MVNVLAFDMLRRFKTVEPETERLVLKKCRNKVTQDELFEVFEKGVSGDYGKFIAADPQTLLSWVDKYLSNKNNSTNYLNTGLIPLDIKYSHPDYPLTGKDWQKEVNKCYHAFLKGISSDYFHPLCYTQMQMDGKIALNEYRNFTKSEQYAEITKAQQRVMLRVFNEHNQLNRQNIYTIVD